MILSHAVYGCCGATARAPLDPQHKCIQPAAALPDRSDLPRVGLSKPRPGQAAEDAMAAALSAGGYGVCTFGAWLALVEIHGVNERMAVREYPFGLTIGRRFRADFAFPFARLLVELEGQAHSIKRQRKGDVLRDQLAQAAGYRILRILPEQTKDGTALALVRAALGGTQ